MIEVNNTEVHAKGTARELLNDWINITSVLYKDLVKAVGVKKASKVFGDSLCFAANIAVKELKIEEKMDEGSDTE